MELKIKEAIDSVILSHFQPHSSINIVVQVLQNDGSVWYHSIYDFMSSYLRSERAVREEEEEKGERKGDLLLGGRDHLLIEEWEG